MNRIPREKRWVKIAQIIHSQVSIFENDDNLKALLERIPNEFPSLQSALQATIESERRNRHAIDLAVEQFSKTRKLPVLNAAEMLLVFHRFRQALDLLNLWCRFPSLFPDPNENIPDSQMLEFLLIYYWGDVARERYIGTSTPHA